MRAKSRSASPVKGDVHRRVHARDRIGGHRLKAVRAGGMTVAVWCGAASRDQG